VTIHLCVSWHQAMVLQKELDNAQSALAAFACKVRALS
jgi:hypothetical protein